MGMGTPDGSSDVLTLLISQSLRLIQQAGRSRSLAEAEDKPRDDDSSLERAMLTIQTRSLYRKI